jgi:hypothetical protein
MYVAMFAAENYISHLSLSSDLTFLRLVLVNDAWWRQFFTLHLSFPLFQPASIMIIVTHVTSHSMDTIESPIKKLQGC